MKKLYKIAQKPLLISILTMSMLCPIVITAQDLTTQSKAPEIQDVDGLRTEFKQYTQDPATKKVKFEMVLKSNIDSDRVRITWTTTGPNIFEKQGNYVIEGNTARGDISIRKGQTYVIPIEVTILGGGVNELFGRAEAFLAESTYIATVRKNYATNSESEVLPITDEYTSIKTRNLIITIVLIIMAVAASLVAIYLGLKQFLKWLDKDERDLPEY